jgi:uncharacterized protein YjbI with pentapeptide repeats
MMREADLRDASLTKTERHNANFTGALMTEAAESRIRPIPQEDVYLFVKRIDNSAVLPTGGATSINSLTVGANKFTTMAIDPVREGDALDVPAILRRKDQTSAKS